MLRKIAGVLFVTGNPCQSNERYTIFLSHHSAISRIELTLP